MDNTEPVSFRFFFWRSPSGLFWTAALILAFLWTLFPTLVFPNYRLDIVEQFFVGQEWTPGSGSHPALTAIALDVISRLTGRSPVAPNLASALFNLLALWAIYRLALKYLTPRTALNAVFAMFCYWYLFQMEGTRFNNSITLDTFWILGALTAFKAVETERFRYWFGTGLVLGVGLYFKYTEIILALTIVLYLLADPEKRRLWRTAGPWVSTLTALAVFLPYVVWLFRSGFFQSVTYAVGNAPKSVGISGHFLAPLEFILNQLPLILPPLICLIPIGGWIGRPEQLGASDWKRRYLNYLFFVPLVFNLLWSAVGGVFLRCDLGCHLWMVLTIWVLVHVKKDESPRAFRRSVFLSVTVDLLCLIGVCAVVPYAPLFEKNLPRYHFPGRELAEKAESIWHERYDKPLPWTAGSPWTHGGPYDAWPWLAGNVSVYGKDHARVYSGPKHCSWASPEDVRRDGGLFLWAPEDHEEEILASMKEDFPRAEIAGTITLKPKSRFAKKDVTVGIALIPPEKDGKSVPASSDTEKSE